MDLARGNKETAVVEYLTNLAKKKADGEAAAAMKKKADGEASAAALKKKADDEAAAMKKADDETAAAMKKKADNEAAAYEAFLLWLKSSLPGLNRL